MSALTQLLDRPIAYQPALAGLRSGNVRSGPVGAVFLSQLIYWHNRTSDAGGWIYKTQADIASETALTRDEQETARRRLVALGVLEEERRGANGRLHFRIKTERLEQLLTGDNSSESDQPQPTMREFHNVETPQCGTSTMREPHNVETPQTGMVHSRKPECGVSTFPHTEITTENTTEIKNTNCLGASGSPPRTPPKRKTSTLTVCPDDFQPTDSHYALAEQLGVSVELELPNFLDHHRAKGTKFKNWNLAFNTWLRNAQRFGGGRAPARQAAPDTTTGADWNTPEAWEWTL